MKPRPMRERHLRLARDWEKLYAKLPAPRPAWPVSNALDFEKFRRAHGLTNVVDDQRIGRRVLWTPKAAWMPQNYFNLTMIDPLTPAYLARSMCPYLQWKRMGAVVYLARWASPQYRLALELQCDALMVHYAAYGQSPEALSRLQLSIAEEYTRSPLFARVDRSGLEFSVRRVLKEAGNSPPKLLFSS